MINDINFTEVMKDYYKTAKGNIISEPTKLEIPVIADNSNIEKLERYKSLDVIDDIDTIIDLIRELLERAWGDNCPIIVDESPTNRDATDIKMPMIIYDYYDRQYPDKTKKIPQFVEAINDNDDLYEIYRELFECKLEFNICDTTVRSSKILAKKFEVFLRTYIPYLKHVGIEDMYFYNEPRSKPYMIANQEYPRRTLTYYVKLQRTYIKRQDEVLTSVESKVNNKNNYIISGLPGVYNKIDE